jgi:hypothetical protein
MPYIIIVAMMKIDINFAMFGPLDSRLVVTGG